jgi:cytochrome c oxidase cbb3-type subunit 2
MSRGEMRQSGWQGASLVAITYVYFLIFAQFAFLKRLASLGVAGPHLQSVMAAMAAGGILFSLLTPRVDLCSSPNRRLRAGLCAAGAAAFLSLLPLGVVTSPAVSFLIGAGLGLLTVTLVTHLLHWTGNRNSLLLVGLGTGVGYLICNIPPFFTASAEVQAVAAGLLCLAGIGVTLTPTPANQESAWILPQSPAPFLRVLACFTPQLKTGTWEGPVHLWTIGLLHLSAALASAWFLRRRGFSLVLSAAFFALGAACLLLLSPHRVALASIFYPIGVSLYSVALVAYPSLLSPASSTAERGRQAGWLYAIAGWSGSAMGIGMGQNLGYVPPMFVLGAGIVLLLPPLLRFLLERRRAVALTVAVLLAAFFLDRILPTVRVSQPLTQVERGRRVYISEGCIHCHSQYVRPNSPDVLMWGPAETTQELHLQHPPLIGNRRQGPDLAEVGSRRSALWLKAHFFDPPEVSCASIMPSYAFLFRDQRGDDLVAYLLSLKTAGAEEHQTAERSWHPSLSAGVHPDSVDGERLFRRHCATCHSTGGSTRITWQANFKRLPPDLSVGPFFYLPPSGPAAGRIDRLAQIAKFGVPGTDMPGHEYLPDDEIASIALWLSQLNGQLSQNR